MQTISLEKGFDRADIMEQPIESGKNTKNAKQLEIRNTTA